MGKKKRYLYLSSGETRLVLQSLIRFKNKLQQQGRYTDCVDELILNIVLLTYAVYSFMQRVGGFFMPIHSRLLRRRRLNLRKGGTHLWRKQK